MVEDWKFFIMEIISSGMSTPVNIGKISHIRRLHSDIMSKSSFRIWCWNHSFTWFVLQIKLQFVPVLKVFSLMQGRRGRGTKPRGLMNQFSFVLDVWIQLQNILTHSIYVYLSFLYLFSEENSIASFYLMTCTAFQCSPVFFLNLLSLDCCGVSWRERREGKLKTLFVLCEY